MRLRWILTTGCLTVLRLTAQNRYYLPEITDGVVAGGSVRTAVIMHNPGSTAATVSLAFSSDDASPRVVGLSGQGGGSTFSLTLVPGASQSYLTDGSGDGTAGAAVVNSSAPLALSAAVFWTDANGAPSGATGIVSAGTGISFVAPVDTTSGIDTGFAVYNPGPPTTLQFALLDATGVAGMSASAAIPAGGRLSRFAVADLFPGLNGFTGSLLVTSATPIAAWALRKNPASAAYTLLSATSTAARRVTFYYPQVADGPSPTATLSTNFQFVNLSSRPASIILALSQDDGSPAPVTAPEISLPPGGAASWQSGGQSVYFHGGAIVNSNQPLAITAIVTSTDAQGNFLGETAAAEAAPQTQSVAAGDGVAVLNPSSQPAALTLNLLDPAGNLVSSAQAGPLPPGGRLSGMVSDLFAGAAVTGGSIEVRTGSPLAASVSVAALTSDGAQTSASLEQPTAPQPALVTPVIDSGHTVSAVIGGAGGSLTLTDAKGDIFTLTIPAAALLSPQTIVMTAVTAASGLPMGTLAAGVQLQPDGLALFAPALLKVQLAAPPVSPAAIGWYGSGAGVYLNPVLPSDRDLTMVLMHFSVAGITQMTTDQVTAFLQNIINAWDLNSSAVAYWAQLAHQTALAGGDSLQYMAALLDKLADAYADAIVPLAQLAFQTQDDGLISCAMQHALDLLRKWTLLSGETNSPIQMALQQLVDDLAALLEKNALQRCQQHDPAALNNLVAALRTAALLGISQSVDPGAIASCVPALELNFTSAVTLNQQSPLTSASFSGQISANVPLIVGPLQAPVDPAGDFVASFPLTGSTSESYTNVTYTGTAQGSTGSCTVSLTSSTPSTLSVIAGTGTHMSRIDYQIAPLFQPDAVSDGLTQLCSFCPNIPQAPASIELYIDPGKPSESAAGPPAACGPNSFMSNYWFNVWQAFHGKDPSATPISGWIIPGSGGSFASKDITNSVAISGQVSESEAEKSSLKLMNVLK
jgi:hypothetical protein